MLERGDVEEASRQSFVVLKPPFNFANDGREQFGHRNFFVLIRIQHLRRRLHDRRERVWELGFIRFIIRRRRWGDA